MPCAEFGPSLDSGVVLNNLDGAIQRLVVRKTRKEGTPQIPTEAFDAPDNTASLEIEGCLGTLRLEGNVTDENNRAD